MDVDQRIALGAEAKRLLSDPLFNGVLNSLIKDAMGGLMSSTPGSDQGLKAHSMLLGLNSIKDGLKSVENDGVVAAKSLKGQ